MLKDPIYQCLRVYTLTRYDNTSRSAQPRWRDRRRLVTGHPDDGRGVLTWSLHNVVPVRVTVAGAQYVDGRVERYMLLCEDAKCFRWAVCVDRGGGRVIVATVAVARGEAATMPAGIGRDVVQSGGTGRSGHKVM